MQIFKWMSIPLVVLALYYQLFVQFDFKEASQIFMDNFSGQTLFFGLLALLLMPVNLGLESLKWKTVLQKNQSLSFLDCWRGIFAGISISIFTPKRIGEYAGRILMLKEKQADAIAPLVVSNLSQSISNVSLGLISLLIFNLLFTLSIKQVAWGVVASVCFFILLVYLYFNLHLIYKFLKGWKVTRNLSQYVSSIRHYSQSVLVKLLGLSLLKYVVFISQFVLLIWAFGVQMPLFYGIIAASSVFFVKTLLPVPATVELAARGSIALFFFSQITQNHVGILVASIGLWILNLGLPAILGMYYISKNN